VRLYLIRHAQTEWNLSERAQGHTDIPLDETGRSQAARLGAAFRTGQVANVYSSDLERSAECARAVAQATGARLVLDPRLRERAMGEWEGLFYPEFNRLFRTLAGPGDPFLVRTQPPGGESLEMVWSRIAPLREELEHEETPAAIVTHGGTASLLLSQLMRGSIESAKSFRFGNASITELHRRPDGLYSLVRYADTSHLDGRVAMSGSLDGISR
jgi:2,3-bisphosphoglycerate-dependent phosphoglycerate mutase